MKAISIKQPWATAIAQALKTIEVRTWQTHYRGKLVICASAKPDSFLKADFKKVNEYGEVYSYYADDPNGGGWNHYGKAIAIVELIDCTPLKKSHCKQSLTDFSPGLYAWHFASVQQIKPFPVKGKLNFYEVPNEKIILL